MKINYISYFDPRIHKGGGEAISMDVVNAGLERGHSFTFSVVRPRQQIQYDNSSDLDFVVDIFNYPGTFKSLGAWRDFPTDIKENILGRQKFIHMSNAYVDICNEPYLPCSGNAHNICPEKSIFKIGKNCLAKNFKVSCSAKNSINKAFFTESKLNIFLSPLHLQTTLKVLALEKEVPSFVLKPTIDSTKFYNQNRDRDINYLFVGVIGEAKGLAEMRQKFANENIHFAGKIYPKTKLDFGVYHGALPYDQIPALMNRAKNFVFLPRWPEPQGRVVIEAALCGCNLITNDRVGATSFDFDIANPANFGNATTELWKRIEGLA